MDLPILKHVDTLIGLTVVMLLTSTVVVAITQFLMSCRSARSSYLRGALSDLISQIAPQLDKATSGYVAERLLRHPMIGRKRRLPFRRLHAESKLPLPRIERGEVILRQEIIFALLDWAAGEGPLAQQDRELALEKSGDSNIKDRLTQINGELRAALLQCGIADPAQAGRDSRRNAVEFEAANPEQPAQLWNTQALVRSGLGDLTGKVFAWYDNSMERVTEFFSLEAKIAASLIGLTLCLCIQLDSVGLLRRLSQDDKFRTALVARAEVAKKAYEDVTATTPPAEQAAKRDAAEKAIRESLDALRDPKASVIPEYLLWENVAQATLDKPADLASGNLELRIDERRYPIQVPPDCAARFPACPAAQIRAAAPPIEVYDERTALELVARNPAVATIGLFVDGKEISKPEVARDWVGFRHRLAGVLLSWILLSLGAPFWYDLLKKLLGFRSILQNRDDTERENRRAEQKDQPRLVQPALNAPAPTPLKDGLSGVVLDRVSALRTQPSPEAPVARQLPAGYLVNVEGSVTGAAVRNGVKDNAIWHRTIEGDFVWDGDVKTSIAGGNGNVQI